MLIISAGKFVEIGFIVVGNWSQRLTSWIKTHKKGVLWAIRILGIISGLLVAKLFIGIGWLAALGYLILGIVGNVVYDWIKNKKKQKPKKDRVPNTHKNKISHSNIH